MDIYGEQVRSLEMVFGHDFWGRREIKREF
jgi:hypothetical protein